MGGRYPPPEDCATGGAVEEVSGADPEDTVDERRVCIV
jgi:hypothetical protein